MSKKVFVVGGGYDYEMLFKNRGWEPTNNYKEADLVQFTGGEDVSPHLYNEKLHPRAYCSSRRDSIEMELFTACVAMKKPMAGICRGGQFLNVMNGGKMFQHVGNHTASHVAYDHISGKEFIVSSTHHQMMRPSHKGTVFLSAKNGGFKEFMRGEEAVRCPDDVETVDTEAVFYQETRSICFQPHPEFAGFKKLGDYYIEIINIFLFTE